MVAHYALQELHVLPGTLRRMMLEAPREYAFIKASCLVQGERNKRQLKEQKKNTGRRKGVGQNGRHA